MRCQLDPGPASLTDGGRTMLSLHLVRDGTDGKDRRVLKQLALHLGFFTRNIVSDSLGTEELSTSFSGLQVIFVQTCNGVGDSLTRTFILSVWPISSFVSVAISKHSQVPRTSKREHDLCLPPS